MIETNIKLVDNGMSLTIPARRAEVRATQEQVDRVELACSRLKTRHHLAAILHPTIANSLIVASRSPVPAVECQEDNWQLTVEDSGALPDLALSNPLDRQVIRELVERALLSQLTMRGRRWVISGRPRHFYEPNPYSTFDGISGYRRMAVSAVFIQDIGIGVACDFQSSFFSFESLAWYFQLRLAKNETIRRRQLFDELAQRQRGQGTLLHGRNRTRTICYFSDAPEDVTCETTGQIRVKGKTFASLYDYYQNTGSKDVLKSDRAIRVAFPTNKGAVWVAARFLRVAVFNDALPRKLEETIHLTPDLRRRATFEFWKELATSPLGSDMPCLADDLWAPGPTKIWTITPPALRFGAGSELRPSNGVASYKEYWNNRTKVLQTAGCFFVPPTFPRMIQCAHPAAMPVDAVRALTKELALRLERWTAKNIQVQTFSYKDVTEGIAQIQNQSDPGLLLFIMNEERNAYGEISTELYERRPKHLNSQTVIQHFKYLREGAWNSRERRNDLQRGRTKWESFTGLLAIDLLQLHDGVPWAIPRGRFEAVLVIDVGHDRRHYGLSLMVTRDRGRIPEFRIETEIRAKADVKHESINGEVLEEEIVRIFARAISRGAPPLDSLLIIRDGRFCGDELPATERAQAELVKRTILQTDAYVRTCNFAKDSAMQIRMWDVRSPHLIENVPEGCALEITPHEIILANTGRTTLHQGTAEPVAIYGTRDTESMREVAEACFYGSQLNWSQPRMAARLLLPLSRTDEELIKCAKEEVRHNR